MPNQFCRYLSNGYSFSINGNSVNVRPCCLYDKAVPLTLQLLQDRKLESDAIVDWTDNCSLCKILENAGQQSLRQTSADWISDTATFDPVTLDINLDSECNAACVMCNEHSSSLWSKENAKLNGKTIAIKKDDQAIDQAIDQIVKSVSLEQVKYVKFFGGEPLFTDTHLKFLQHIPHPENVTLHYTTNGSIYPNQQTLDSWKQFKTVIFAASIDGIKEQFDYVRWPLPWHKVSENILRLRNNSNVWNVMFRIEFTANFLNAYYYDRVEQWMHDNLETNLGGDQTEINIHQCWGEWAIEKMPMGIRQLIMEKYTADHRIYKLVSNLPTPPSLETWQNFVKTWDQRRNNQWQQAFPDLAQYL
jgi:sulfatase maturation enzyme AslB (radical SAM superfamily)